MGYSMADNEAWLEGRLSEYIERWSPDGGMSFSHLLVVGNLRHYTRTRFFPAERVRYRFENPDKPWGDPSTEEWIQGCMASEKQDEALEELRSIYEELRKRVPAPAPADEFL